MERDGRAVRDGFADAIFVEISFRRVVFPEGDEGPLSIDGPIDGRAGEADVGRFRQGSGQVVAQFPAGGPVGFIDEDDDVLALVDVCGHSVELVDHRDDQAPAVPLEQFPEVAFACHDLDLPDAYRFEVPVQLAFQFVPVYEHDDGRVLEDRVFQDLLGGDDHGVGLAGTLGVPDQTAFLVGIRCPLDEFSDRPHLVGSEDDLLEFVVLPGEEDIIGEEPDHAFPIAECLYQCLEVSVGLLPPVEEGLS